MKHIFGERSEQFDFSHINYLESHNIMLCAVTVDEPDVNIILRTPYSDDWAASLRSPIIIIQYDRIHYRMHYSVSYECSLECDAGTVNVAAMVCCTLLAIGGAVW